MEKTYKPVPDVEALRYKGTPDKPDIKIFVSHRIDLDSETIDNPLYIPVRCGAVYDERENVDMLGDDTGDNISEKRMTFNEFTVMYWAWKNVEADYYGLCHYRRFLSFYKEDIPFASLKQGIADSMSPATLQYYGFMDEDTIRTQIEKQDIIVPYEYHMKHDMISDTTCRNIKEQWLKYCASYLKPEHFDAMLELIRKYAPQYYSSAVEYCRGKKFRGFNCCIMKKEYFFQMCEFIFPILFEFNDQLKRSHFSTTQNRACGYLGEWLFSIFVYHIQKQHNVKLQERQLIAFLNTDKSYLLKPYFQSNYTAVVLPLNDGNRPLVAVTIQSLLSHVSTDRNYDIILLQRSFDADQWCTQLKKQQNHTLMELCKGYSNVSLRFYDPKNELGKLDIPKLRKEVPEEQFYMLFLPWILPDFERVTYLSDGLLVNTDIAECDKIDLKSSYIAAVKNPIFAALINGYIPDAYKNFEKKLQMKDLYGYIAAEFAVLNLSQIRKGFSHEEIEEYLIEQNCDCPTADCINQLFEGKISFLHQRWNRIECCSPEYFKLSEYIPSDINRELSDAKNLKISNLRGMVNGWIPQQSQTAKAFWQYAQMTPFYEELLFGAIAPPCHAVPEYRSNARKIADRILPIGSTRRNILKLLIPKDSVRWRILKKIYYTLGGY